MLRPERGAQAQERRLAPGKVGRIVWVGLVAFVGRCLSGARAQGIGGRWYLPWPGLLSSVLV